MTTFDPETAQFCGSEVTDWNMWDVNGCWNVQTGDVYQDCSVCFSTFCEEALYCSGGVPGPIDPTWPVDPMDPMDPVDPVDPYYPEYPERSHPVKKFWTDGDFAATVIDTTHAMFDKG